MIPRAKFENYENIVPCDFYIWRKCIFAQVLKSTCGD